MQEIVDHVYNWCFLFRPQEEKKHVWQSLVVLSSSHESFCLQGLQFTIQMIIPFLN